MLFTGDYEHTIDAQQRLSIPSDIRAAMDPETHGKAFFAVPGPNGHLWLWPERTFERLAGSLGQSLVPGEEEMEFEEILFSQATRLELDKVGRVRMPDRLLSWAGLGQSVVILGIRDHLELRDPTAWFAERDAKLNKVGEIMLRTRRAMERGPGHRQEGGNA